MLHASFVAAKFAVALNLRGREHLDGGKVVLEVGLPQRRMRGADRFGGGRQRCRRDRLICKRFVQFRLLG